MGTSSMNIRMDSEVKAQAQALFAQFGLDMTTAVNIFLRQALSERAIPFRIAEPDPFYSGANWRHITAAIEEFYDPSKPKIIKTMEELEAMANE
jgi:DNA-damage-inducible protein J